MTDLSEQVVAMKGQIAQIEESEQIKSQQDWICINQIKLHFGSKLRDTKILQG